MAQVKKQDQKELIRQQALNDLPSFIHLVHPKRVLGSIHYELCRWWNRPEAKSHQLVLLPRDHQKSAMAAYDAVWQITRNPSVRILYISSTSNLATKQLGFIKDILTSDVYRFYWPEMVHPDEGKRKKWTETEISVDHPKRAEENVRDPTIFTAGLTTSITGLHCDFSYLDDIVVRENAYTEEGREKTRQQYSLLASIESADGRQKVVGTRYFAQDLYYDMQQMRIDKYDTDGNLIDSDPLYETFERQVESAGDGSGEYLWPRQQRYDGVWFGFNQDILSRKRGQYLDRIQFRAQYYNDPSGSDEAGISRQYFQYYDPKNVTRFEGKWFHKGKKLNVFAAADFAFSLAKKADYTAIVVVGIDQDQNYYVLDIDRFKTEDISTHFLHILKLHQKWDFRKIRLEVAGPQKGIVEALKKDYIRPHGLALTVEDNVVTRHQGTKEERVHAVLQPRYANNQIWHYQGGNCQTLEEELVLANPSHDDVKDALAACVDMCIAPSSISGAVSKIKQYTRELAHSRFGGLG